MYTAPIKIDYDKIYQSNTSGPFKIIREIGRNEKSKLFVEIEFLNTGTRKIARYDIAMVGRVLDELRGIDFNKIYTSVYYGPYKIVKYLGRLKDSDKYVRIRFLNTGYEYDVCLDQIRINDVKDHSLSYHKILNYSDNIHTEEYEKFILKILKTRWNGMMARCYNPSSSSYSGYGAIGVTVCDFWKDFDNYYKSFEIVPLLNDVEFMPHHIALKYLINDSYKVKFNDYPL